MEGSPAVDEAICNAEFAAGLVDEPAEVGGLDGVLAPGGHSRRLDLVGELLGGVDLVVVDPLLVGDRVVVVAHQLLPVVKRFDLLRGELAGEDVEVFAASPIEYIKEPTLARNRLVFMRRLFANSSLAPFLSPVYK